MFAFLSGCCILPLVVTESLSIDLIWTLKSLFLRLISSHLTLDIWIFFPSTWYYDAMVHILLSSSLNLYKKMNAQYAYSKNIKTLNDNPVFLWCLKYLVNVRCAAQEVIESLLEFIKHFQVELLLRHLFLLIVVYWGFIKHHKFTHHFFLFKLIIERLLGQSCRLDRIEKLRLSFNGRLSLGSCRYYWHLLLMIS